MLGLLNLFAGGAFLVSAYHNTSDDIGTIALRLAAAATCFGYAFMSLRGKGFNQK